MERIKKSLERLGEANIKPKCDQVGLLATLYNVQWILRDIKEGIGKY